MMQNARPTPARSRAVEAEPLWVVTSYYNPAGYHRRLENYHAFRRNLRAPLLAIELAAEGRHQLTDTDADKVIHLTGEDRIWQKERLINIAVAALPPDTRFVAWVDCDIIFENARWVHNACTLLRNGTAIVQLFDSALHMPHMLEATLASRARCRATSPMFREQSFAHCLAAGTYFTDPRPMRGDIENNNRPFAAPPVAHGVAWAAHRELVAEHGLYDACIIGGGDRALALAIIGHAEKLTRDRPMTVNHAKHYLEWAQPVAARTKGKVGVVPGSVYHLWHGSYKQRHYVERHELLKQHEFDPYRHLEIHDNKTWRWDNAADRVKDVVGDYFLARHEDG